MSKSTQRFLIPVLMLPAALLLLAGCKGYSSSGSNYSPPPPAPPILSTLNTMTTIGPTAPSSGAGTGDQNPYGLAIAPVTSGLITAGDLVICNFNNAANVQGTGTTVVGLHPAAGSTPYLIAQSASLLGCSAVAMFPDDSIAATADQAGGVPVISSSGTVSAPYSADTFHNPWSIAYVAASNLYGAPVLYVSNTGDGSLDRITLGAGAVQTGFTEIAKGFSVNGGAPGSISAPAGLTYDPAIDTLYVVDTNANRVIALNMVSAIGPDGVVVNDAAPPMHASFSGPSMGSAKVIADGAPLNGPISGALLANEDLVVGNTLDATGTNLLIEVSPTQGVVAMKNVDTGAAGALFGIATTGNSAANQKIYFNDDNSNSVVLLSH